MATSSNPFQNWLGLSETKDYRSRETQASAFTRQMLTQAEYLRSRNRVNPGRERNTRAAFADSQQQKPHFLGNEDMWGWQAWAEKGFYRVESDLAPNLLEEQEPVSGSFVQDEQVTLITETEMIENIVISSRKREYTHIQSVPSANWVVEHNLGFYPSVELIDSNGREMDGNIIHNSPNRLTISLNVPESGKARLN
jgi:hypothetical protein